MNTQKYQLQLTPEQTLAHLTRIAAGLLASGFFPCDPDPDLVDVDSVSVDVAAVASSLLHALVANIEGEINEGDARRNSHIARIAALEEFVSACRYAGPDRVKQLRLEAQKLFSKKLQK